MSIYKDEGGFVSRYPQALKFMERQSSIFWPAHEVKVEKDVHSILTEFTEAEMCGTLTVLKLFTLYEMIIGGEAWGGRFKDTFKAWELQCMASLFSAVELSVHLPFYKAINDVMSAGDPEFYISYKDNEVLDSRMKFIDSMLNSESDHVYLAAFCMLEGAVLFSSFAFLKSFQANGQNKVTQITSGINFSLRDESLHATAAGWVFQELCKEKPLTMDDRLVIHMIAQEVAEVEHAIIDMIFEKGPMEGITKEGLKQFASHRVQECMVLLGLEIGSYDAGPVGKWFYDNANSFKYNDFFVSSGNEYTLGWFPKDFSFGGNK